MADTVIVGCKLPHGLETQMGGVTVVLNGTNSTDIVGGYGLTYGVDKAAFEQWLIDYANFEPVKREMIFANATEKSAKAEAIEKSDEKSGLEGLDPAKPAPGIEPDPDQKQKA